MVISIYSAGSIRHPFWKTESLKGVILPSGLARQSFLGRPYSVSKGPELGNEIIFRSCRVFEVGCDGAGVGKQVGPRL